MQTLTKAGDEEEVRDSLARPARVIAPAKPSANLYSFCLAQNAADEGATWFDARIPPATTRARLLSIKILTNRCLAYAKTDSAAKVSKPVLDLLWPLLQQFGGGDAYR